MKNKGGFLRLLTDEIIVCNTIVVISIAQVKILEHRCKGNARLFLIQ